MKNEPAFPTYFTGEHALSMTLRDYFAAKAMQSLIASAPSGTSFGVNCIPTNNTFSLASYALADAMLKAREA
jgi:hypothetical protein